MINEDLRKRAETLFNTYGELVTGQHLKRKELKQLEREGLIEKQLMKNKDTGQLIYQWRPVAISKEIIKKP